LRTVIHPALLLPATVLLLLGATAACDRGGDDAGADADEPGAERYAWTAAPGAAVETRFDLPVREPVEVAVETEHPSGVTVRVHAVRFTDAWVEVDVSVTNRHPGGRDVIVDSGLPLPGRDRRTSLRDDLGGEYVFSPAFDDEQLAVEEGLTLEATLAFFGYVPPQASELHLVLNDGAEERDDPRGVIAVVEVPIALDADAEHAPAVPHATHPSRTLLRLRGATFAADHTVLDVQVVSRHMVDHDVMLNFAGGMALHDDVGGVYRLVPPPEDPDVTIAAAEVTGGRWVFAGGVDPAARTLTLRTNEGVAGTIAGDPVTSTTPAMVVEEIAVPDDIRDRDVVHAGHPNGTVLHVTGVEVAEGHVSLDILAANALPEPVALNASGVALEDDAGGRYELEPPADRPTLEVPGHGTLTGRLRFTGVPEAAAGTLTLTLNDGSDGPVGNADQPLTDRPLVVLESIPLPDRDAQPDERAAPASEVSAGTLEPSILTVEEAVATSAERVRELLVEFDAEPVEDGILVTFPDDVLFDFDRADITPEGAEVLERIHEVLVYYDEAPVRIHGHTDSVGDPGYNQQLSERRAEAVRAYLVDRLGVPGDRLTTRGFGETRPVASNDTEEGRALNRRVEVLVETDDHSLLDDG
jgi:outer membrane protein OmpA-like peptidoglycan-associated protein